MLYVLAMCVGGHKMFTCLKDTVNNCPQEVTLRSALDYKVLQLTKQHPGGTDFIFVCFRFIRCSLSDTTGLV